MKNEKNRGKMPGLFLGCVLVAFTLQAFAQKQPSPPKGTVPLSSDFKVLNAKPAAGKVVKGAPYSATATTETVQTLSDGNQIIRRNEIKLYRDSEGRTRTEQTLATIGKWANQEAQQIITINDPVTGYYYDLNPRMRTAVRGGGADRLAKTKEQLELLQKVEDYQNEKSPAAKTMKAVELTEEMKRRRLEKQQAIEAAGRDVNLPKPVLSPEENKRQKMAAENSPETKHAYTNGKEPLGKQMIEGVEAEGVRVTITIAAGEIGNVKPIEIVEENWYSPALQIVVLRKQRDPRSGETTYRLTNINRSEPDRALFEVPADYTINTNKAPTKPKPREEE